MPSCSRDPSSSSSLSHIISQFGFRSICNEAKRACQPQYCLLRFHLDRYLVFTLNRNKQNLSVSIFKFHIPKLFLVYIYYIHLFCLKVSMQLRPQYYLSVFGGRSPLKKLSHKSSIGYTPQPSTLSSSTCFCSWVGLLPPPPSSFEFKFGASRRQQLQLRRRRRQRMEPWLDGVSLWMRWWLSIYFPRVPPQLFIPLFCEHQEQCHYTKQQLSGVLPALSSTSSSSASTSSQPATESLVCHHSFPRVL